MIKSTIYKIKKDPIKFFLLKILILSAIIVVLDFSIGNVLSYFYFNEKIGFQYRTTYSIEKTRAEVVIFGSSRASHHYHPDIFIKRLNHTCYNAGRDGNFIFYHYAVLKGVLKRYTPKIVILDFNNKEFKQNQDSYDRISLLLPYYRRHPEIHSIIELKGKYEKYKLLSSIYPFNSSIIDITIGNTEINKNKKKDINGYLPLMKTWNSSLQIDSNSSKYELDSAKIEIFESFIKDCIDSKVKLYIVCSPSFIKSSHVDYSLELGKEIAKKYNVLFLNYSNDSLFINNSKLFADIEHLNDKGAKVFSNMLIDTIRETNERKAKK